MKCGKRGQVIFGLLFFISSLSSLVVQIGNDELLNQSLPIEPFAHFSYSQMTYLADEVGSGGLISSLGLQYRINSSIFLANNGQFSIYMGCANRDRFTSMTDWVPLDSLQLVFQGDLQQNWFSTVLPGQGWLTIPLTNSFDYSASGNLVIAIDENNPGYSTTGDDFYCTASTLTQSLIFHSNTINPDPAAPPSATSVNPVNPVAVRANIRLEIQPVIYTPYSPQPADLAAEVALSPSLNWQSSATSWDVWLAEADEPLQQIATGLMEPSFQVPTTLSLLSEYHWQVIAYNSGTQFFGPVWSFTTIGETLTPPLHLQAYTIGMTVQLNWDPPVQGTIAGFRIMRGQQVLDEIPYTNYLDEAVQPGQTYWYQVLAVNYLNQVSPPSNLVSATLPPSLPLWQMSFDEQSDFSDSLAGWILSDLDNSLTWQWDNAVFPGEGAAHSWLVFNPFATTPPILEVLPHNGQKMLLCPDSINPPNNDWLISPQISIGNGYNLSFWVRSYSADFGQERLRCLISDSDVQTASFQPLSAEPWINVPADWTQINYDLSAYAGQQVYLAWQCVSWDAFALCLDEIYLTASTANSDAVNPALPPLSIYPNPASKYLMIDNSKHLAYKMELYNTKGRRILSLRRSGDELSQINLPPDLPSGMYIVRLQARNLNYSSKIAIIK